jgi:saccharopine dehydrogenase-like NADP-dependent oxidoreductase
MKKIVVLGGGMIGSAIAFDLSSQYKVTVVDFDTDKLNVIKDKYKVKIINEDLSDPKNIKKIVKDFDLVICAVPGFMGFATLKTVIETGKNVVDISFFNEDPFELDNLAKRNEVTAVVDCGVAPGLSNIILGFHNSKMEIKSFECFVGGLPEKRVLPFQYKAPFSPIDVIEEYTRPVRMVEDSKLITRSALSEIENIEIEEIGTLEAFNTDGLRTLIKTMNIPNMKEKTLRYPGHIKLIKFLNECGFFGKEDIEIKSNKLKPVDFTSKLLFPLWHLEEDEKEFTVLMIRIIGKERGNNREHSYKLLDLFDEKLKITSMARTTGFTCTSVARLLINEDYKNIGISPPEFVGADETCFNKVLKDLNNRGIQLRSSVKDL